MKEMTVLLEKLADKLGTTVEKLWGAMIKQAPISAAIELVTSIFLIVASIIIIRFVQKKTTELINEYHAAWEEEGAFLAWVATGILVIMTLYAVMFAFSNIVTALLNPEYWALSKIISAGKCK